MVDERNIAFNVVHICNIQVERSPEVDKLPLHGFRELPSIEHLVGKDYKEEIQEGFEVRQSRR